MRPLDQELQLQKPWALWKSKEREKKKVFHVALQILDELLFIRTNILQVMCDTYLRLCKTTRKFSCDVSNTDIRF